MEEHQKHPGLHFMDKLFSQFPSPMISFKPSPTYRHSRSIFEFATLLGDDEDKILAADNNGNTTLLDTDSSSHTIFRSLNYNKGRGAIAISMTNSDPDEPDRLYVIRSETGPINSHQCFEMLRYGFSTSTSNSRPPYWYSLPPPPPDATYTLVRNRRRRLNNLCLFHRAGTWRHSRLRHDHPQLAKNWLLEDARCAVDLSEADMRSPPTFEHTWLDLDIPKSWSPFKLNLISLGSGRFCVVKMFHSTEDYLLTDDSGNDIIDSDVIHSNFAVFTGLHIVPRCNGKDKPREFKMIKHKSMSYTFDPHNIPWVI
uniref:Uncharacterized protein n=1 Tax=Leersia perrieri TaxID=77586 RepID=A0A0D9XNG0_9ORYZ